MEIQQNPYKERFVAGFCNAGTPFSTKIIKREKITNPLRIKADELLGDEKINFWDDDWTESFCFLSGGILGLTMIPIDALFTGVFTVKETFGVR
jgi:hypothetical protein